MMLEHYIDLSWYKKLYGKSFRNKADAIKYYLNEGEPNGEQPNPIFDPIYYRNSISLGSELSALRHYLHTGVKEGLRPCKYFDAEWYRWQNPDVNEFNCSVLHYLNVGGIEYRDPCPEVDMTGLSSSQRWLGDGCVLTYMLSAGLINIGDTSSVINSEAELVNRQRSFLLKFSPDLLKSSAAPVNGRNLLFVQCAQNSEFWNWFNKSKPRNWDLFLNCYAGNFLETSVAEYVCIQPGTKFTGMFNSWLSYKSIFDRYDYVFYIDDDLRFNFEDISSFFNLMKHYDLDLAQPSLSHDSQCVWQVFFNAQPSGFRKTNGVEIMMPALSGRARKILLPYFFYSVSGFGLDLLMAKLSNHYSLNVGVLDDIVVQHGKKIDQREGSYYKFLRSYGINSKYELQRLIKAFDLERCFY